MTTLSFGEVLLSLIGSIAVLGIAIKKRFFSLPLLEAEAERPTFLWVFGAFAIYFLAGALIPVFFFTKGIGGISRVSWASFTTSAVILSGLLLYSRIIPVAIRSGIWGRLGFKKDLGFALIAWLISFPVVVCVGHLLAWLVYLIFHVIELPDQVAIKLMKYSFGYPKLFLINTISVIIFAPIIEELLFRGFLQKALGRWMPKFAAICGTSLIFSLFHYSKEQGLGNIPLLGSLFVFSWFLGFVYERQKSLFASISLHATFNTLSILGLYFLRE